MHEALDTMKKMVTLSSFFLSGYATSLIVILTVFVSAPVSAGSSDRGEVRVPLWGSTGHHIINLKAVMHLPGSMAALKADSMFFYNHASDADNRKDTSGTSFFSESERHYIDIDAYPNYKNLSHDLNTVISQYGFTFVHDNGTLPWAVVMMYDTLVAQLKRHDTTSALQSMADLGHYVGDAHQPLHCTENYNGTMTGNTGIHSRYESSMLGTYQSSIIVVKDSARYIASPIDYIFDIIYYSNSYVDTIMAADTYAKSVSGWTGSGSPPASYYTALWLKTGNFTKDLFQRATVALASFWYTASVNAQLTYTITASSGANGSITPSGDVSVNPGGTQRFTFNPASGYEVDSVIVDGVNVDSIYGYTFTNVTAAHTIYVSFRVTLNRYIIGASAGPNGSITPSGMLSIVEGGSQRFTFAPATGCHIDSVLVDGVPVDSTEGYTFSNISAAHEILVRFAVNTYFITSAAGEGGSISPTPGVTVNYGASPVFVITPDAGYQIDSVLVDEIYVGNTTPDTIKNVTSPHAIRCVFGVSQITTIQIAVADKWNLISVPLRVSDYTKTALYPDAVSDAFAYQGVYNPAATLARGAGYWMKFSGAHSVPVTGYPILSDTINLLAGWNIIGGLSSPISVLDILTDTPGLVLSSLYRYGSGYIATDSLYPGFGYWVKANVDGQIILSTAPASSAMNRVRIEWVADQPPSPPDQIEGSEIPGDFRLEQNYPNPFNPSTIIQYQLPADAYVSLKVYNTVGQKVAALVDGRQTAGYKSVKFENAQLPSGVYVYRLQVTNSSDAAKSFSDVRKMLLVK
jgi:hypothetical protein